MPRYWTKADRDAFEKQWLSSPRRQGHQWVEGQPRCTACGRKYGKGAGAICPKRKKPNRWRLHLRRAERRAQVPPVKPPVKNAAWVLSQLEEIKWAIHVRVRQIAQAAKAGKPAGLMPPDDMRFWKYSREARRHRALLRLWWSLPASSLPGVTEDVLMRDRWEGQITRGRNKLLERVKVSGCPIVREGETVYTFKPDAFVYGEHGRREYLFPQEEAS